LTIPAMASEKTRSRIQRVIGLPGEIVKLAQGEVFIDGQALDEPYILPEYRGLQSYGPIQVPPRRIFCDGGPSQLLKRQPVLGNRIEQSGLRQGGVCLLAD